MAILHLIFPSTLQQDERPGVKLPCNQSRALDGVHLSTSGSMDQFDRPDSTSSGGGWTQHQGRLMRLGLIASEKNPEDESLFRQAEEEIPPTEPNGRRFSSGAGKFRSSHLCSPWNCYPLTLAGYGSQSRRSTGCWRSRCWFPRHDSSRATPPSRVSLTGGWSRMLGRGPGHLKLSTFSAPRDEICVAA